MRSDLAVTRPARIWLRAREVDLEAGNDTYGPRANAAPPAGRLNAVVQLHSHRVERSGLGERFTHELMPGSSRNAPQLCGLANKQKRAADLHNGTRGEVREG
jgi:hypothetical protein